MSFPDERAAGPEVDEYDDARTASVLTSGGPARAAPRGRARHARLLFTAPPEAAETRDGDPLFPRHRPPRIDGASAADSLLRGV